MKSTLSYLWVNWKTTSSGLLALLVIFVLPLTDGDPSTTIQLSEEKLIIILSAIGLLFARDGNKSSQDSEIRPPIAPTDKP